MVTTILLGLMCWLHPAQARSPKALSNNKQEQKVGKAKPTRMAKQKGGKKRQHTTQPQLVDPPPQVVQTPAPATPPTPPVEQVAPAIRAGQVIAIRGQAGVQRSQGGALEPIHKGTALFQGDTISTQSKSNLRILMADQSVLDLAEQSTLALQTFAVEPQSQQRNINLAMLVGKLWARIAPLVGAEQFNINMPNAVAGIRGTSLVIDVASPTQSSVAVLSGEVALQYPQGDMVSLGAMEQTILQDNQMAPITAVNPEQINQLAQQLNPAPQLDNTTANERMDNHQQFQNQEPPREQAAPGLQDSATPGGGLANPMEQQEVLNGPVLILDPALNQGTLNINLRIED